MALVATKLEPISGYQARHDSIAPAYFLLSHIYICVSNAEIVLLDTKRDRYFGVTADQHAALSQLVMDWPAATDTPTELSADRCVAVADALVAAQVLTKNKSLGKSASPISFNPALLEPLIPPASITPSISVVHILVFLYSLIRSAIALRFRPFDSVLRSVQKRRASQINSRATSGEKLSELLFIFSKIKPFLFTSKNHCLFHALTIINFFSVYHQYPTWVIGVGTYPFGAHSWVQYENFVIDATPEEVFSYTPILAI